MRCMFAGICVAVSMVVCGGPSIARAADEAKIKANLAKLSEADRKLAEAQKFCVIEDETPLGATGVPMKLTVKGKPVFICCDGCKEEVEKAPDKALKKVEELIAKNKKK